MKTVFLTVLVLAVSCSGQLWKVPSSFEGGTKFEFGTEVQQKSYHTPTVHQRTYTPGRAAQFDQTYRQTPLHGHTYTQHHYTQPAHQTHTYRQPSYTYSAPHSHSLGTAGEVNIVESRLANGEELKSFPQKTPKYYVTDTHIPLQRTIYHQDRVAKTYLPARAKLQDTWPPRLNA